VGTAVPTVEIADYTHRGRLRRPNGECDAFRRALLSDVRAKLFVDLLVAALTKKVKIDVASSWFH